MDIHTTTREFIHLRSILTQWFLEQAMPFLDRHGTDWREGGFFERFNSNGEAVSEPRRTRVTARQIYVATQAKSFGWAGDANAIVEHGVHFLLRNLLQPSHTFAASVETDGTLVNADFDLYEQAFALFALAHAYRTSDKLTALLLQETARNTIVSLQKWFRHPLYGFEESSPPSDPLRANPHMHLLEAFLAWEAQDVPDVADWRVLSDEIARLALRHLIDPVTGVLSEYFDHQWERSPGVQGDVVEPGHQFEWAWLLMRWGAARREPEAIAAARRLIATAEQYGVCPRRGVVINRINHALEAQDQQAKLWPQTERIKAWCACIQDAQAANLNPVEIDNAWRGAGQAIQALLPYLHHQQAGLWQEVMLQDGSFSLEPCRASSLYHIVCAIETLHSVPVPIGESSRH